MSTLCFVLTGCRVVGLFSTEVLCLLKAAHPGPWHVWRDSRLGP